MTFEGWNWSLIGSVAGLATTLFFAAIPLIDKLVNREKKPKLTEEEKLQAKHAKTRSKADRGDAPDYRGVTKTLGSFVVTMDDASQVMHNQTCAFGKQGVPPYPVAPPNVLIRDGSTKAIPMPPPIEGTIIER